MERDTSITICQRSRTRSMRSPASNEIISDSVEPWDTDVCFLHIQLMVTNVRLRKNLHCSDTGRQLGRNTKLD